MQWKWLANAKSVLHHAISTQLVLIETSLNSFITKRINFLFIWRKKMYYVSVEDTEISIDVFLASVKFVDEWFITEDKYFRYVQTQWH